MSASALADIKPKPFAHGPSDLSPKSATVPVSMDWEVVDLWPEPGRLRVEVVFGLRNTGQKATNFEVGFPSWFDVALDNFEVWIDGEQRFFELKRTKEETGKKRPAFVYWLCWPMEFSADQERLVKVRYTVPTAVRASGGADGLVPERLRPHFATHTTGYVLRTGAAWHGPIGKATIRIHHSDRVPLASLRLRGRGWAHDETEGVSTLVLKDFEPKEDIRFSFRAATPERELALLLEAAETETLAPRVLKDLLLRLDAIGTASRNPKEEDSRRALRLLRRHLPSSGPYPEAQSLAWADVRFLQWAYAHLDESRPAPKSSQGFLQAWLSIIERRLSLEGRLDARRTRPLTEQQKSARAELRALREQLRKRIGDS